MAGGTVNRLIDKGLRSETQPYADAWPTRPPRAPRPRRSAGRTPPGCAHRSSSRRHPARSLATAVSWVAALAALALSAIPAAAGLVPADWAEPHPDTAWARIVRGYTSDPAFLPGPVSVLPTARGVPAPREFLGHVVGAPGVLTRTADIHAYFRALADASPRIRVESMGRTNEGREMIVAFVADAGVLDSLEALAHRNARLAEPRSTDEADAEALARLGRPFYWLTGGLHSTETGSPEMLMELAYRLVTGESPLVRRIRSGVVTMITPVLEPDGRDRMVDWYESVTSHYTDWDDMPQRYPPYWGRYVLHDNNRDGIQLTQPLTRNTFDTFFRYFPQVMHDLHESVPLLYVSAGTGPYNDALDPLTVSEWHRISQEEVATMNALGVPGVWTWGFYTGWWPGYLMWLGNNHNGIGRFYETFGNAGANTFTRKLEGTYAGRKVTTRQWYRPWPPEKKVTWSARDNVNYMETGVLVALDWTARNGRDLLFDFWRKGRRAVERGRNEAPHAWIVPRDERRRAEIARLVETLVGQRIEVHTLARDVRLGERTFHRGDVVVRLDQPYGRLARSLMEPQRFPDDAEFRPYDDVAWTLPLLYGVEAVRIDDPAVFDAPMHPVRGALEASAPEPKRRRAYAIDAVPSYRLLEARVRLGQARVWAADTTFRAGGRDFHRGAWLVEVSDECDADALHAAVGDIAREIGLDVVALRRLPRVPRHEIDLPRIAVYHTWMYTQDSGWVRWVFDRQHVPYTLIDKDDLRAGHLRDEFDVILVPSTGNLPARRILRGIDPRFGPLPWRTTPETPAIGRIDSSDDITGGMGAAGLLALERFLDAGGTLITLGGATVIPVELGLVRHVDRVRPQGLLNPGSVLRARVMRPDDPIAYGYDERPAIFRGNLPLFQVDRKFRRFVVMQYGTKPPESDDDEDDSSGAAMAKSSGARGSAARGGDSKRGSGPAHSKRGDAKGDAGDDAKSEPLCLSGYVKGPDKLEGKPAVIDMPAGSGRVVMFTFNPMHRHLTLSTYALVANAILHWNDGVPR